VPEVTEYQILKRHKWLCRFKIPHETEVSAQTQLHEIIDSGKGYLIEELNIYVCKACGFLHIGHLPKWKADGRDARRRLGSRGVETGRARGDELRAAKEARNRKGRTVDALGIRGADLSALSFQSQRPATKGETHGGASLQGV
jgi:hypothetical protein